MCVWGVWLTLIAARPRAQGWGTGAAIATLTEGVKLKHVKTDDRSAADVRGAIMAGTADSKVSDDAEGTAVAGRAVAAAAAARAAARGSGDDGGGKASDADGKAASDEPATSAAPSERPSTASSSKEADVEPASTSSGGGGGGGSSSLGRRGMEGDMGVRAPHHLAPMGGASGRFGTLTPSKLGPAPWDESGRPRASLK